MHAIPTGKLDVTARFQREGSALTRDAGPSRRRARAALFLSGALAALGGCQDATAPRTPTPRLDPAQLDAREPLRAVARANDPAGYIEVCKIGSGTALGQTFSFVLGGSNVVAQTVTAVAGTSLQPGCTGPIITNAGAVTVQENVLTGFTLDPANPASFFGPGAAGSSINLATRTATVNVVAGNQSAVTIVTFRNIPAPPGYLKVCKIGIDGALGQTFNFALAGGASGNLSLVAGGAAQGGNCTIIGGSVSPTLYPAGTVITVTEGNPAPFVLTDVTVAPAGRGTGSVATRVATVTIGEGENIATFTNGPVTPPPQQQYPLQVCKIGGAGVATGTAFSFTTTFSGVTSAAVNANANGACVSLGMFPLNSVVAVTEAAQTGTLLTNIQISGAGTGTTNLGTRSAAVTIGAGTNIVTFTNVAAPTLRVCKQAGNSGALGQTFSFTSNVTGAQIINVTAGAGATTNCQPVNATLTIGQSVTLTEQPKAGYFPFAGQYTQTITIQAGQNTVTFVNFFRRRDCNLTQGFYKNHGYDSPGNQENEVAATLAFGQLTGSPYVTRVGGVNFLNVGGSTIGGALLTDQEIQQILRSPPKGGDAELILLHQLIAAELNVIAQGTASTAILADIARAQVLLVGGISAGERAEALAIADRLDAFNNSDHCE